MSDQTPAQIHEDFDWALQRVQLMRASAYADAEVYGKKLLKGFGYPNEVMSRAQDARALSIVLRALADQGQRPDEDELRHQQNARIVALLKSRKLQCEEDSTYSTTPCSQMNLAPERWCRICLVCALIGATVLPRRG